MKRKSIEALQRAGLETNQAIYCITGDEDIKEDIIAEQELIAEEIKTFIPLHQSIQLNDFEDIHPIKENVNITENPMCNSISDKHKRIGKIVIDTETGQRKIIYDNDLKKLSI
jgi:hypothetical protein